MSYNFYYFDFPYKAWVIATEPDEAVVAYQTTVSDIQDGVSFEVMSDSEFLESFAGTTTEEMPTIERGLTNAALTMKDCLFDLAQNNKTAKILAADQALI
ncbi:MULTISPECIES: hypothetical protein [unclassified Enterococcus]|uniref:hypothetical protein n=1 Tax=unclassified Enterococcus TaxID=2608891 RepID=UPI001CE0F0A8|nr:MULTISPECIES: hypothetical protein [unclassified Enterococcus]MCA5014548.1 hypothetical protein [Enterococcus sp. S23]MCA5017801.1 hypothetical protein [Enterococcus sp. S22(2020)]